MYAVWYLFFHVWAQLSSLALHSAAPTREHQQKQWRGGFVYNAVSSVKEIKIINLFKLGFFLECILFFNVFMSCRQKDNVPTVILYRTKMTVRMRTIIVPRDECKDKFDYNCDDASTEEISSLSSEHSTGKLTWCNDHSSCDWSLLGHYVWQPSPSSYTRLCVSQCNMYINYCQCVWSWIFEVETDV